MAMAGGTLFLSLTGTESAPGWWDALFQGLEEFFDVERVRDTLLIVLSVGVFLLLVTRVLERMLFRPMRVVLVEELRSLRRSAPTVVGSLGTEIDDIDTEAGTAAQKEKRAYQALLLLRDLQVAARRTELDALSGPALIAAAAAVKDKLSAPIDTYLTKTSLTADENVALRQVLVEITREQAAATAIETRLLLRRIRKSMVIATGGALLIVLLVMLFGNPALVAFGVLGAVVSRMIAFFRSSTDDGQKYNWVALILTPVVGGLSGFAGVLLIEGLRAWGILGDVFEDVHFGGVSANRATLAAAFLFGFTERFLDSVVGKAMDGLAPIMADPAAAGGGTGGGAAPATGGGGPGGGGAEATEGADHVDVGDHSGGGTSDDAQETTPAPSADPAHDEQTPAHSGDPVHDEQTPAHSGDPVHDEQTPTTEVAPDHQPPR